MLVANRGLATWHLILADLALILFLVTASALENDSGVKPGGSPIDASASAPTLQPSQALYRAGPGLVTLEQWLGQQPRDPRASLTIVAQHAADEEDRVWKEARAMAQTAQAQGVKAQVIIRPATQSDLYASLGYDQPID